MQGEQVSIPGATEFSPPADLLLGGNLHYRWSRHSTSSLLDRKMSQPLLYQRVRRCANLLWSDLVTDCVSGWSNSLSESGGSRPTRHFPPTQSYSADTR